MADAKKLLAESGCGGTPVVIMALGDVVTLKAESIAAAQLLREAGRQRSSAMTERRLVSTNYHPQILSRDDERIEATPQSRPMSRGFKGASRPSLCDYPRCQRREIAFPARRIGIAVLRLQIARGCNDQHGDFRSN
jgi:phosphoketolase